MNFLNTYIPFQFFHQIEVNKNVQLLNVGIIFFPPIYKQTVICRLNNEFLPKLLETKKCLHQDIVHKIHRLSDELAKVSGTTITNRSHTEPKRKKEIKILRLYDPELEEK